VRVRASGSFEHTSKNKTAHEHLPATLFLEVPPLLVRRSLAVGGRSRGPISNSGAVVGPSVSARCDLSAVARGAKAEGAHVRTEGGCFRSQDARA